MLLFNSAFIPIALAFLFGPGSLRTGGGPAQAGHIPQPECHGDPAHCPFNPVGTRLGNLHSRPELVRQGPADDGHGEAGRSASIAKFTARLDELRKNASTIGGTGKAAPTPAPAAGPAAQSVPVMILDVTTAALASGLAFIIITLFLLTGGPPMMARMGAAFSDTLHSSHVLRIIDKVRAEVGHFYATTTLINCALGVATGLVMWAWGMPTPLPWGAMAAILNYIPYAGAVTTLTVVTLVAIVSFESIGHVLGVAASYVGLAALEGQVAQPLLVGRRMEVNPLLIFLALQVRRPAPGHCRVILATPTLVALKVIAENSKSGKPMLEFLGPNNQSSERDVKLKKTRSPLTRLIARGGAGWADS